MQYSQANRALKLNMDKDKKILGPDECFFLLNHERYLNKTSGSLGKGTPHPANYPACEVEKPAGENYAPNTHYSPQTKESYSWVYNSNGVHYVQRINSQGECEIVYYGCLNLSAEPRHAIHNWRAYVKIDKLCANVHGKQLIWADGLHDIGQLDVEASIATNFFTTPFFDRCPDPCAYVRMCVPDPCGCIFGEFVPIQPSDAAYSNNIIDQGFQFSYRHVYYDGRASLWAEPSTLFYQSSKGCFDSSSGFPRCIRLRIPIGNPLVDKIEVAYIKDGQWFLTDTVEKYKKYNSSAQYWYERDLAELTNYSDIDCSFDYIFCNNKLCELIDPSESGQVVNQIPREPQGFIQIKDSLGFYNYKKGNCPVDKFEVSKFDIRAECTSEECSTDMVEVTVRAIIHNTHFARNQFVYRLGGNDSSADDPTDKAFFGGLNPSGDLESGYDQFFNEKVRNFIVYTEGDEYWAEMKQWKSSPYFNSKSEVGVLPDLDDGANKRRWRREIENGNFFYQEAKIKVPRGTRGFLRLASHHATGNDQDTSTFVIGVINSLNNYNGNLNITSITDVEDEEIYFDACGPNAVVLSEAFVIGDNAIDGGFAQKSTAYCGYIKDANGLPVEGAIVTTGGIECGTDHNGFYHFYRYPGDDNAVNVDIQVERNCYNWSTVQTMNLVGEKGANTLHNETITDDDYRKDFYALVKMAANDCSGVGIGGVRVALSGSKFKITDASGVATFRIRNYRSRDREVIGVILNNNGCFTMDCGENCQPCMPKSEGETNNCYMGTPIVTLAPGILNRESVISKVNGLKSGGRYPFGFIVRGDCGRLSAVNEVRYIDIPKVQETGKMSFCSFSFNGNDITLPGWAKCLDIVRGENINSYELQWLVDKVERNPDGKIILTIQSLNDYNEKYSFKSNTIYKWLQGDRVEFISNGDGKVFGADQLGILNYLTVSPFNNVDVSGEDEAEADFFNQLIIEDDGRLSSLVEGAKIEIQRTKVCTTEPVYFGICTSIPIDNGKLMYQTGTFHTFDSYIVNRTIGKFPVQRFEHHSPSDFWGSRVSDAGRAYFTNKYENERRYGRNISLNSPGQFNRFGDLEKTFSAPEHGDLTAVHIVDGKIILAIGEHDSFLAQAADDLLRVGSDGVIRALPADSVISDPEPKLSGRFGCQYDWVGSIHFGDGWATFVDVNNHHYVKHDYSQAKPADEGLVNTFFMKRCQEIETHNRNTIDPLSKFRFCTGYNSITKAVMLTTKTLRHSGVNNGKQAFSKPNDTIMYHPISEDFLGFVGFTPDAFSNLDLFGSKGCAFLSYLNGVPYIHPIIPDKWNEFFGVSCDWVIGVSLNKFPEKRKRPLAMEVQSQKMWFATEVTTDKDGYLSEIPPIKWAKDGDKYNAAFLSNKNSREGLFGDDKPRGYHCAVTLVRDNTDGLKYGTINPQKRLEYSEIDEILFKFTTIEQSGFTGNL